MKTRKIKSNHTFNIDQTVEGEPLEITLTKMMNEGAKIEGQVPMIYTERKDGVRPETNIRTDRWEIAQEAMGRVAKSHLTRRRLEAEEREKKEVKDQSAVETISE